ncbi:MAG: insulinase family protein, partial [Lachnospiraceae bacterium]|nr:insulinase family protein [Lachnospiraceae bacterium]
GGITFGMPAYTKRDSLDTKLCFEVRAKVLYDKLPFAFEMIREVLFASDFSDKKRIRELIAMQKSRMEESMPSSGHVTASNRALACCSMSHRIGEAVNGITFYRFVSELDAHFDDRYEETVTRFKQVCDLLFVKRRVMVDYTSGRDQVDVIRREAAKFTGDLPEGDAAGERFDLAPFTKNEGFKTSSKIQYVALAGNFRAAGLPYTGALRLLKVLLGYDYLWNRVRVLGGAYGCMCGFRYTGAAFFTSYRDPNLKKTLDVYREAADYLRTYEPDERDLTKSIIGTIADLDAPLTPQVKGVRSMSAYLCGMTDADAQKERDEVLSVNAEKIHELADYLDAMIRDDHICVVGNEEAVEEEKELFDTVENLIQ